MLLRTCGKDATVVEEDAIGMVSDNLHSPKPKVVAEDCQAGPFSLGLRAVWKKLLGVLGTSVWSSDKVDATCSNDLA